MAKQTKKLLANLTRSEASEENLGNVASEKQNEPETIIKEATEKKLSGPKSFIMLQDDYDFLHAYMAHRRFSGDIKFTIKEALQEAIELLRAKNPNLLTKPAGK